MTLIIALLMLATEAPRLEKKPVVLAKGSRQLGTTELRAKVVGSQIELVVPPEMRWLHPGEDFYKDGKYILWGHGEKWIGTYTIADDAICTKVEGEAKECRFIFVDVDGLFWIAPNKMYADQFRQVRFKMIEDR